MEGATGDELDWLEKHVRGNGVLGWTGGRYCLFCRRDCSSGRVRGRPLLRFSLGTDSGVDTDSGGEEILMCWRFLMPFVLERSFAFWTWAARAASLNAFSAVTGAGVMVIFGFFGVDLLIADFFNTAVDEDGMVGATGNDDEAVAAKNTCGLDRLIGLGRGPKRDVGDVSEVAAPAGVVVTAAFGSKATI